jgi:ABC-type Fe3+-hydroxamate transport system substrate-binding protein
MNLHITDQIGRDILISKQPRRVISCVPSQTELLFDLGAEESVAGITKFCIHPGKALQTKTMVGGTKNLHLEKIASLEPDFILANKEENDRDSIEWLAARFPTYVSDVRTLDHALIMIHQVGAICGRSEEAVGICDAINERFAYIKEPVHRLRVAYIIWQKPWMTINADTFIHDLLHRIGFDNVFAQRADSRYPVINAEEIIQANPQFIFLSSEPFPFQQSHIALFKELLPSAQVLLVDGEMFSWYGSRLQYFNTNFLDDSISLRNNL